MLEFLFGGMKKLTLIISSAATIVLLIEMFLHFLYFVRLFPDVPVILTRLEKYQYVDQVSPTIWNDNISHNGRGFRTFVIRDVPRQLIEFSSDGMRLDEFDGPALCTVGIFGDSFVEALQVGQNEDLSSLTESALRRAGYDVNFQNFGHGGDGTTYQYLRYNQLVEQGYEFDQVFLFFYPGNDVANNKRELNTAEIGRYPYFIIESGLLKRADSDGQRLKSTSRWWQLKEFLAKYSHLSNLVMNVKYEFLLRPRFLSYKEGTFDPSPDRMWEDAWLVTEKVLEKWSQDATQRGTEFILVMLASMGQLTGSISAIEGLDDVYPNERLRKFTSNYKIHYIDTFPIAKEYIRRNNLKYTDFAWLHDNHYSQVGHGLIADTLIKHFLANHRQCLDG